MTMMRTVLEKETHDKKTWTEELNLMQQEAGLKMRRTMRRVEEEEKSEMMVQKKSMNHSECR